MYLAELCSHQEAYVSMCSVVKPGIELGLGKAEKLN